MEMVAAESVGIGQDLTPPLPPIAYSLHDPFLPSHCASCFSPLPSPLPPPPPHHRLLYCSPSCSSSYSPLHVSSAAHLLSRDPSTLEPSDLRVALLLLLQIRRRPSFQSYDRICGLMSNRHSLLISTHDDELFTRIRNGARMMAAATSKMDDDFLLEEAVLCAVVTNAVEVQDRTGRSVGIAVYDVSFSWINHSCSPNACYRFLGPESQTCGQRCLITPACSEPTELLTGFGGGPRLVVRSIKTIQKGEQVTIAYTDLLQPKELRQSELWSKYRFTCGCLRCAAVPLTYVDQRLQDACGDEYLADYIDDAIHDYLFYNDAETCCIKLEDALLRLHPQNYLSLNAYTTLASAYATAEAFKMKRFSAAYSLLLALLTHDLFLNESSLIASVSNYWISAGESLIRLAKCSGSTCSLSEALSGCGCEASKEQLLQCISGLLRGGKVWKYLVAGNSYLEVVNDPTDLGWFEDLKSKTVAHSDGDHLEVFGLGAHCLLHGRNVRQDLRI